ncbi:hypothetical protein E3T28_08190 [Cryobacterium sinapicolor]|uniref:Uncharacterized protein n=1 Tax=Cryobacterium sinapicolor TaxID=1259236 RepID=A0ABY2J845_9MICO|nr:sce7725 family protein [Cryobacterium sinapicolor]TFD00498.1 hypothetical protein E3T28_08190 [Cryobacterium sinapicolor]
MYFPYLYGRRAERNALIDVATTIGTNQAVHPIVEPYSQAGDLIGLLDTYKTVGAKLHLVVNPTRGTLQTPAEQAAWTVEVAGYVAQPAVVTPVMHVSGFTTGPDLALFLATFHGRDVALVVLQGGLSPITIAATLGVRPVRVFVGPLVAATDYVSAMPSQHVVPLVPRFPINVNANYPAESAFSLDPKSYGPAGFGDFALIDPKPPRVGAGGAGAGAVAVHMTYQEPSTNELKVQHFLSDDRIQKSPPDAIKLLQSIQHMTNQQTATPGRFLLSPGYTTLESYLSTGKRTSLEKSKQQQISHHLHTVAHCL